MLRGPLQDEDTIKDAQQGREGMFYRYAFPDPELKQSPSPIATEEAATADLSITKDTETAKEAVQATAEDVSAIRDPLTIDQPADTVKESTPTDVAATSCGIASPLVDLNPDAILAYAELHDAEFAEDEQELRRTRKRIAALREERMARASALPISTPSARSNSDEGFALRLEAEHQRWQSFPLTYSANTHQNQTADSCNRSRRVRFDIDPPRSRRRQRCPAAPRAGKGCMGSCVAKFSTELVVPQPDIRTCREKERVRKEEAAQITLLASPLRVLKDSFWAVWGHDERCDFETRWKCNEILLNFVV